MPSGVCRKQSDGRIAGDAVLLAEPSVRIAVDRPKADGVRQILHASRKLPVLGCQLKNIAELFDQAATMAPVGKDRTKARRSRPGRGGQRVGWSLARRIVPELGHPQTVKVIPR